MYRLAIVASIISCLLIISPAAASSEVREQDNNSDGKTDLWIYYDDKRPEKIESD